MMPPIVPSLCLVWLAAAPAIAAGAVSVATVRSTPRPVVTSSPLPTLPAGGSDFHDAWLRWSAPNQIPPDDHVLVMPLLATRLSSGFGVRRDPLHDGLRVHQGIDIPDLAGAPVRAAAGGRVTFSGWRRGYGNLVQIDHGDGNETRYGHLSAISVHAGTVLQRGMVIGEVGSTGRSTGPHLHFELRRNGFAVDPLLDIPRISAASPAPAMAPVQSRWQGFSNDPVSLPQPHLR